METSHDGLKDILASDFSDAAYLRMVGHLKRAAELYAGDADFRARFDGAPEDALRAARLSVEPDAARLLLAGPSGADDADPPRQYAAYCRFTAEKIRLREEMKTRLCAPSDERFRAWRGRQSRRCWIEMGARNFAFVHAPLAFELSLGCSVGCPFCGLAAERLQKVFRWSEENERLWRGVLRAAHEAVGDAAGHGTCYYATEPLDNPDYERFIEAYYDEFGIVPQTTTAAAARHPERVRRILAMGRRLSPHIDRFSLTSREAFRAVMELFSVEELVPVELLTQFPEAPSCLFAKAGRARDYERQDKVDQSELLDTIACLSGFVINMAEGSIRLVTPVSPDEAHPTGERLYAKEYFSTAGEFCAALSGLMEAYMPQRLEYGRRLRLHPFVHFSAENGEAKLLGRDGYIRELPVSPRERPVLLRLTAWLEAHREGSARDMAAALLGQGCPPAYTLRLVRQLWEMGVFDES